MVYLAIYVFCSIRYYIIPTCVLEILQISYCTGVLCQSFTSSPDEICPGDSVAFTCVVEDPDGYSFTSWIVTRDGEDCVLRHNVPNDVSTCGPGLIFTASLTDQSGDNYTSTLRVESISDGLNDTRVECEDASSNVGMENICIISKLFIASSVISVH